MKTIETSILAEVHFLPIRLKIALTEGSFATLRITERGGRYIVRDGRSYGTEKRMMANLASRPKTAQMFRVGKCERNYLRLTLVA